MSKEIENDMETEHKEIIGKVLKPFNVDDVENTCDWKEGWLIFSGDIEMATFKKKVTEGFVQPF